MPDKIIHEMAKDDKDLESLRKRMEELINSQYWPSYLYNAKVVALSKNGKPHVVKKDARIISVLPAVTKLIEILSLNKMKEQLYGTAGIIHKE